MKTRVALFILLLAAATFAFAADTLTVGTDVASPNGGDLATNPIRTDISLDPATAGGSITSVKIYWSDAACADAFKIVFFRRLGDLLIPSAQRGPFTTTSNVMTIVLTPPVNVEQGDLIGVIRLTDCGNPGTSTGVATAGYLSYYGEVNTNTTVIDGTRERSALALSASGTATTAVTEVLPAVGSVNGLFGSSFKTSLQLLNPSSSPMTGYLIFNPHGVAPSRDTGSAYQYSIPAGQQITVDLAAALTGSSSTPIGLGSLDVDVTGDSGTPQVIARVYNDSGSGGTAGFFEDPISLDESNRPRSRVIPAGATAFMVTPVDPARTRFNIGVRALFSGAELTAELLDNNGHVLASSSKRFAANYFEQVDAASFFNGVPIGASQTIRITVTDGSAVVYGSTTDNVTNDPSVQYAIVSGAAQ